MIWLTLKRIIRTGFSNFWRNGVVSLSAVLVMSITLLIVGTVVFNSALLEHTLTGLKEKVDVNINMTTVALEDEVLQLKATLENLPEVSHVDYLSRQEVLDNYVARHQDDQKILSALDELDDNPFGAALNVKAKSPDHYESVQTFLEANYPVDSVGSIVDSVNYARKKEAIDKLNTVIVAGESFGVIITILFIFLSILITLNTIRLAMFISRNEIQVMNLVGAEKGYISGPFIVTGAVYGFVSAVLVLILFYPITYWIGPQIAPIFFDLNIFDYYIQNFGQFFLIIFLAGILIGSVSSLLAVSRYIKK